ncbi:MAG: hypothetical protein ACFFBD_01665 [Candidatus Hodarchaeota archaeon]
MSHRKLIERLLEFVRDLITDPGLQATYRLAPQDFTRTRKLTFERVFVGVCQATKLALQLYFWAKFEQRSVKSYMGKFNH